MNEKTLKMEREQILHAAQTKMAELDAAYERQQRVGGAQIGSGASLKEAAPAYGNQREQARQEQAMCARETARSLIIMNIDRLDRERAGLVALLDVLPTALHQFYPQADEALFEMVSRRR